MLRITCPYCGPREQDEFSYGGEAHRSRPGDSESLDDSQWAEFVFMRSNTKGIFAERWMHSSGCRKWFNALRNTATDRFIVSYPMGQQPPQLSAEQKTAHALPRPAGEPTIGSGNDGTKIAPDIATANTEAQS